MKINTYLGKVELLKHNPRTISDSAFTRLCESVKNHPEILLVRGFVIWQVPEILATVGGQKCPFAGQEGRLVILGGNQRCKAFMALGKTEIPEKYIKEAKGEDGRWWPQQKAEYFVSMDNGAAGISGEFDYKEMAENFNFDLLKDAGIDFAELAEYMNQDPAEMPAGDTGKSPTENLEEGENGEKNKKLDDFKKERMKSRIDLKEIDDTGFHLLVVFKSFEEKAEFISKMGLTGNNKRVAVNGSVYLDLVFESYKQKMEFVKKAHLDSEGEDGEAIVIWGMFADGRAMARKLGIELEASGLHARDRVVDNNLVEMAREGDPQKNEEEISEEQFVETKKAVKRGRKGA